MAFASWQRTIDCGALRAEHVGQEVVVNGWANSVRDHGGVVFMDLRDRTGLVQIVADPTRNVTGPEAHAIAEKVKSEWCIAVRGRVAARPEGLANPNLETGAVEIEAIEVTVFNAARTLPFQLDDKNINEEARLKYRYLDLRRPEMYRKMHLRHEIVRAVREYFYAHNFLEIETPVLTKSSPEGARDYLVPYRLQAGKFYALPQAPQQFKQLLMVAGMERYFQIAKCFRDESQRADRQPEFTQIDLEMAFATQDDVLSIVEGLMIEVVERFTEKTGKTILSKPFPRFSFDESMRRFGTDKPDIRFGLELIDCAPHLTETQFAVFQQTLANGGQVKAVRYPGGAGIPRREMDELGNLSRDWGAKGMAYFLVDEEGKATKGPVAKFLSDAEKEALVAAAEAKPGDLVGFIADQPDTVAKVLDRLRRFIGGKLGLIDKN
ncbi:aspartate--tRNA ligase, partial [Armatimonas sp.]|uniref:aspartate--tRNA ligase n=1 Tax=Armatimonas sp. TaxID=1872638 RepID=UPI0037524423